MVTVDVEAASSVTTVSPLASFETLAEDAFVASGVVLGRLYCKGERERES